MGDWTGGTSSSGALVALFIFAFVIAVLLAYGISRFMAYWKKKHQTQATPPQTVIETILNYAPPPSVKYTQQFPQYETVSPPTFAEMRERHRQRMESISYMYTINLEPCVVKVQTDPPPASPPPSSSRSSGSGSEISDSTRSNLPPSLSDNDVTIYISPATTSVPEKNVGWTDSVKSTWKNIRNKFPGASSS